jgi:hypothetical protein
VRDGEELIEMMEANHPEVQFGVTASWPHYIDGLDGDADLAVLQRSPVDPPGEWDFISVMAYSSYYPPLSRAYYTYSIERMMARLYPEYEPFYLIGVVGYRNEPLLSYDELVRDAHILRAMEAHEIGVFYLGGALRDFGDDFVQRFTTDVNGAGAESIIRIPFSRTASLVVYGVATGDALLDIVGWRGILLALWSALCGMIIRRRAKRLKAGKI